MTSIVPVIDLTIIVTRCYYCYYMAVAIIGPYYHDDC